MVSLKAIFVGDASVGKTCIAQRIVHGTFNESTFATIGAANLSVKIETESKAVVFNIWDTAGQERYRSLAPMYFNGAGVAFLVFDLTRKSTFDALSQFYSLIEQKAPEGIALILVGNKKDLPEEEYQCDMDEINEFSKKIGARFYIETSAKTGENIVEMFRKVVELEGLCYEPETTEFVEVNDEPNDQNDKKSCC